MKKKPRGLAGAQINRFRDLQSNQNRYPDLYYYCYCDPILPMIVMSAAAASLTELCSHVGRTVCQQNSTIHRPPSLPIRFGPL